MILNTLILGLVGNVGVAAYGVVANISLVAISVFNGISQGAQPLLSDDYGRQNFTSVKKIRTLGMITACFFAFLFFILVHFFAGLIVEIFNSEQNMELAHYAERGLKIYVIGFFFAGMNIMGAGFFSATENAMWAFYISVIRGFVTISVCAVILAKLFAMTGVWLAFPVAEGITLFVTLYVMLKRPPDVN